MDHKEALPPLTAEPVRDASRPYRQLRVRQLEEPRPAVEPPRQQPTALQQQPVLSAYMALERDFQKQLQGAIEIMWDDLGTEASSSRERERHSSRREDKRAAPAATLGATSKPVCDPGTSKPVFDPGIFESIDSVATVFRRPEETAGGPTYRANSISVTGAQHDASENESLFTFTTNPESGEVESQYFTPHVPHRSEGRGGWRRPAPRVVTAQPSPQPTDKTMNFPDAADCVVPPGPSTCAEETVEDSTSSLTPFDRIEYEEVGMDPWFLDGIDDDDDEPSPVHSDVAVASERSAPTRSSVARGTIQLAPLPPPVIQARPVRASLPAPAAPGADVQRSTHPQHGRIAVKTLNEARKSVDFDEPMSVLSRAPPSPRRPCGSLEDPLCASYARSDIVSFHDGTTEAEPRQTLLDVRSYQFVARACEMGTRSYTIIQPKSNVKLTFNPFDIDMIAKCESQLAQWSKTLTASAFSSGQWLSGGYAAAARGRGEQDRFGASLSMLTHMLGVGPMEGLLHVFQVISKPVRVITLLEEPLPPILLKILAKEGNSQLAINVADGYNALLAKHLHACCEFFMRGVAEGAFTYVHCVGGRNRSATIVVALLMLCYRQPLHYAIELVQRTRSVHILLNDRFRWELMILKNIIDTHKDKGHRPSQ
eukprot:TRINITY_DN2239_c0_g4_i1.p1 TRINITY_DN2239_c0_g4~~TRINITY_DN2239_c0_g4_i1.p1  ORF type:complete len:689 (+),score=144.11 TRINITY_DN2239_c0_g4_i1:109-2067(+)